MTTQHQKVLQDSKKILLGCLLKCKKLLICNCTTKKFHDRHHTTFQIVSYKICMKMVFLQCVLFHASFCQSYTWILFGKNYTDFELTVSFNLKEKISEMKRLRVWKYSILKACVWRRIHYCILWFNILKDWKEDHCPFELLVNQHSQSSPVVLIVPLRQ